MLEHWNIVQNTLDSSKGQPASWVIALRRGYEFEVPWGTPKASAYGFHCVQPILPDGDDEAFLLEPLT
jgi:hypothetical protein